MKKMNIAVAGLTIAFGASAALAQQGVPADPTAAPADAPAAAGPEGAPSAAAPAEGEVQVTITQQDVEKFAVAMVRINEIQGQDALDEAGKQQAMAAAVQEAGLEPMTFNTIAQEAETNTDLRERVQLAIAQQQSANTGS